MTDDDLKARFAELKKHDERGAPDFATMWRAPRTARSRWRLVVPIASVAAAAMLMLWCGARVALDTAASAPPSARAPASRGEAVALDPAPLDFLLETPPGDSHAALLSSLDSNPLAGW